MFPIIYGFRTLDLAWYKRYCPEFRDSVKGLIGGATLGPILCLPAGLVDTVRPLQS